MKRYWGRNWLCLLIALAVMLTLCGAAAETYSASSMRLLQYEGTVEIEDAEGAPRFVMENARFNSGEAMRTGADSLASVGLDETKVVTLDAETRVEFKKEGNALRMKLTEGQVLLDVQEKLDENESLDIETSTLAVGIRGTIVFLSEQPAEEGGRITTLGVLEGTAQVTYGDEAGQKRTLPVPAGQKIVIPDQNGNGLADLESASGALTAEDIHGFVREQVEADATLTERVNNASDVLREEEGAAETGAYPYADNANWAWSGTITLVAQSASKLYDGQSLTRPGDVLVYGLPAEFSIRAAAAGSQTDAGTGINRISSYAIYNAMGEEVTSHFHQIETVDGRLVVDPAPLTVWTGSAEKTYDGEPLTNPEAELRTVPGYERDLPPWRNASYVGGSITGGEDSETLYGLSGVTWVHGTNPLTGETQEIMLYAGQKLTVNLHTDESGDSLEYVIKTLAEAELPEDVLRVYADNPALLAQACADTGWDSRMMAELIAALPEQEGATETRRGLQVSAEAAERLMTDSTNVRITIDTEITSYDDRALNGSEARFTPILLDESIHVTATGSQTEVGESINTYEIDWGSVSPANYIISEELGTLTVHARKVVPTATPEPTEEPTPEPTEEPTAEPTPTPEPTEEPTPTPEPTEEPTPTPEPTEEPTPTPEITEEPTAEPTEEPTPTPEPTEEPTATPEPTEEPTPTAEPTEEPTATPEPTEEPTPTPEPTEEPTPTAEPTEEPTATPEPTEEPTPEPTEEPTPEPTYEDAVTFTGKSAEKTYDGTALTGDVEVSGLPTGFTGNATAGGSQTDAGSSDNMVTSWQILDASGADVSSRFTNVSTVAGTLTVNPAPVTVFTGSDSKTYDGTPLVCSADARIEGMVAGDTATVTATGTITNVGTAENGYTIDWGTASASNYTVTENLGTLEVVAAEIQLTAASAEKVYDSGPLTNSLVTAAGLPSGHDISAVASGSQTDVGEALNEVDSGYVIRNADGADVTACFAVSTVNGTLTVNPAPVTIITGSDSKAYDGTPLVCSADARIEGMVAGETATVTATGTITKVGTAENGYTIDWGTASASNYTVTENLGTLEVVAAEIQLTAASAEKVYDGGPLTNSAVTAAGLPSEHTCSATASGSQTDVGEALNEVDSGYMIRNADGTDVTACFAVSIVNGTLKVEAQKLTVDLGEGDFDYNGEIQLPVPSVTYMNGPFEGDTETCDLSGDAGTFECSLANGETMALKVSGAERSAGEYTLSGSSDLDSSGNYEIVHQAGKSVINPCYVEITLGGTFPYQEGATYYPEIKSVIPQGEVQPASTSWGTVNEGKVQITFNWGSTVDVIEVQINQKVTVEAGGDGDYPIPEGSASVIPNDHSGNYTCYFPASMMTISEPEGTDIGG